ncbi:hypothetical protein ACIBCT_01375 [Streptosporangium sp. NPDC050855]|uniref:hypothetical protein n=1 Tax=Streptosporangium sp. NPDC050855 TaxID=3366194 RepID=UPI00379EB393
MAPVKHRLVRYLAVSFALAVSAVTFQPPIAANADDVPGVQAPRTPGPDDRPVNLQPKPLDATPLRPAPDAGTTLRTPDAADAAAVECCGLVIRYNSIQNLVVAANINAGNVGKGGNCNIWNWNGGNVWSPVNPGRNCDTRSMNGHTYSWNIWADTDAFTLQYEDYWLNFHGSWRRIGANVYTKISSIETAKCYRESDGVNCYVVY